MGRSKRSNIIRNRKLKVKKTWFAWPGNLKARPEDHQQGNRDLIEEDENDQCEGKPATVEPEPCPHVTSAKTVEPLHELQLLLFADVLIPIFVQTIHDLIAQVTISYRLDVLWQVRMFANQRTAELVCDVFLTLVG
jgi:hypothetical protein